MTESLPPRLPPGKRHVPSASTTLDLFGNDALPQGFRYQPDFLSREEEQSLLGHIVPLPFSDVLATLTDAPFDDKGLSLRG